MSVLDRIWRRMRRTGAEMALLSAGVLGLGLVGGSAVLLEARAVVAEEPGSYAGDWHWMFKGKSFATVHLLRSGDHFTGYLTDAFFKNDASGEMTDAGSEPGQSPIVRTFFAGDVLHIVVEDDHDKSMSEWTMKLLGPKRAEFQSADPEAPKNLKPWMAERASN